MAKDMKIEQADDYVWRQGSWVAGNIDANDAAEVLNRIAARDGVIQAQAVVDEAKPKHSPIHPAFEWKDGVAANEYRKWQARQLVRSVRAVRDEPRDPSQPIKARVVTDTAPAFFFAGSGTTDSPSGYYPSAQVVSDLDLYHRALEEATLKLKSAERAVQELTRLAEKAEQRDRLASLTIAVNGLMVAQAALRDVRH